MKVMRTVEFANSILFGRTLADKLVHPGELLDEPTLGQAFQVPDLPSRPTAISFVDSGQNRRRDTAFPTRREMEKETGRGRIMHFFANHELLALELMALMLLRFPDASPQFRQMLGRVMKDEQRHLKLYLDRMQDLGVSFGDVPVGRFFWDCLKDVTSPLAFLAGMSLTFEQANLDFCLQYQSDMTEIGDVETAEILDVVYRDEIGHVAHGWDMFTRMRTSEGSAFEDYQSLLPHPLSPRHARGKIFSRDARRRSGLPEEFIDEVEVFSSSRGRPPYLYVFNPDCEGEMLAPERKPNLQVRRLTEDLETLPGVLASGDDLVLVTKTPSTGFLRTMKRAGFDWPSCVIARDLKERKLPLAEARPWGPSPVVDRRLVPFDSLFPTSRIKAWSSDQTQIHRKSFASALHENLLAVLSQTGIERFLSPPETIGQACTASGQISARIASLRQSGYSNIVLKADLGASGRNMIRLLGEDLDGRRQSWLDAVLEDHGCVVVEPWLNNIANLSLHFDIHEGVATRTDLVAFHTDRRGQFRSAVVSHAQPSLPREIQRWLNERLTRSAFDAILKETQEHVAEALTARNYRGPVGVDMLFHRDELGDIRFRPLVEINPRWTMGRVALALRPHVRRGSFALFEIEKFKNNCQLKEVMTARAKLHTLEFRTESHVSLITAGFLSLVEISESSQFVAGLWVGRSANERVEIHRK